MKGHISLNAASELANALVRVCDKQCVSQNHQRIARALIDVINLFNFT